MEKFDLIVVGGGYSGVCAAISASRKGLKVLLADNGNALGGTANHASVIPFMPYWTMIDGEKTYLSDGLFTEIRIELEKVNGILKNEQTFDTEWMKIILNRMAINAGVTLLFHANLLSVSQENGKISSAKFLTKTKILEYSADYFIDATGDATLSDFAGFSTRLGRESDNLCQPMTLIFSVNNVDMEKFDEERPKINPLFEKYRQEGKISIPREQVLLFKTTVKNTILFNTTRICKRNPVDPIDYTLAEIEAREQVVELYEFLKNNFECFSKSELFSTASTLGVRESRMINGEYILTKEDILACKKFDDGIACGNYDIDVHNPEGTGTTHYYFKAGEYYTIPYRCLIPLGAKNLLVAGRCISVDHDTQASIRIMPICATLGQATGTAVAIAKKTASSVSEVDVKALRDELIKDGAFLGK